jgi:hypothetical protein
MPDKYSRMTIFFSNETITLAAVKPFYGSFGSLNHNDLLFLTIPLRFSPDRLGLTVVKTLFSGKAIFIPVIILIDSPTISSKR